MSSGFFSVVEDNAVVEFNLIMSPNLFVYFDCWINEIWRVRNDIIFSNGVAFDGFRPKLAKMQITHC